MRETITLASGSNECLKALCTEGASPDDDVPACNTDDAPAGSATADAGDASAAAGVLQRMTPTPHHRP